MKELKQIKRLNSYSISIIETKTKGIKLFLTNWNNNYFEIDFDISNGIPRVKAEINSKQREQAGTIKGVQYIKDNAYTLFLMLDREKLIYQKNIKGIGKARVKFYEKHINRIDTTLKKLNSIKISDGIKKKVIDN